MSQLYFLEFFIAELNLGDQIIRDSGETVFAIKINFIDFPTFEITRQNVSSARVNPPRIKSHFDFRTGQACHFTSKPEKLVKKILRRPLLIRIFREGDSFPMCLAELPLSGCLCDQAKSAGNFQLPKPYVFGGTIGLVDIGGNPSGNVNITLRITCRGKYVLGSYVLEEGCFLFKDDAQGSEFRVERLHKAAEIKESENREYASIGSEAKAEFLPDIEEMADGINWENYVRDVGAIFPSAGSLSLGKPPRKPPRTPLAQAEIEIEIVTKKGTEKMKRKENDKKKKKKEK